MKPGILIAALACAVLASQWFWRKMAKTGPNTTALGASEDNRHCRRKALDDHARND